MSNTDKAIELSNRFKCLPTCERCKNIEDACYSMALWKKQQLIDKARSFVMSKHSNYFVSDGIFELGKFMNDLEDFMKGE